MKKSLFVVLLGVSSDAFCPRAPGNSPGGILSSTISPEQKEQNSAARYELESFASVCNPKISFFDPLKLADQEFWGLSNAATIAYLRHAEMKHGRIAMLGFIGYVVQANDIVFPWATEANGFPPAELSPPDQWDLLDPFAKFQLFFFIGCLELWSEVAPSAPHYMKPGGVPGKFPSFTDSSGNPLFGFPRDLWDPLGLISTMDTKTRAVKLAKEVNNGRLAMLGFFGFLVESKIPGAVPLLTSLHVVQPYSGEYWQAFGYWDFINYFFDMSSFSSIQENLDFSPW